MSDRSVDFEVEGWTPPTPLRCTCAADGSACRCPHHTREDFDAADRAREGEGS